MAVKCKELVYTPLNALTFRITGGTKSLIAHKIKGVIYSLEGPDGIIISLTTTTEIKKIKYKVNIIERTIIDKTIYYDVHMAKRTKSSIFIMPMLGGNKKLFFWDRLFANAFIETPEEENCIALLYRWSADPLFVKFEKALSKFKSFRTKYDPNPYYVLFIFDVPKNHKRNYKLFKNGKYSKFSKTYKIDILDFHDLEMSSEIGQILFQDDKRKKVMEEKLGVILEDDSELLSIINKDEEIFNIEKYELNKLI
tara:strand:- start:48 stop:806 length:759 start_codon:yes stop_codon:yes gene_type:complete